MVLTTHSTRHSTVLAMRIGAGSLNTFRRIYDFYQDTKTTPDPGFSSMKLNSRGVAAAWCLVACVAKLSRLKAAEKQARIREGSEPVLRNLSKCILSPK